MQASNILDKIAIKKQPLLAVFLYRYVVSWHKYYLVFLREKLYFCYTRFIIETDSNAKRSAYD